MTRREYPHARRSQRFVLLAALVTVVAAAFAYAACQRDVHALRSRLDGESRVAVLAISGGVPPALQPLFDVRPELQAAMTARERDFVERMVGAFLPVSARAEGLRNEGAAIDPAAANPLPDLRAPTLIVHARDDGITPFATAQFTAEHLPQAEFLPLSSGGHLLSGHHAAIAVRIATFLETPP